MILRFVSELARIMPINIALMFAAGPLFVIGGYFQALGDAKRAALIGLIKPYAFFLPLLFGLPFYFGEAGIWLAGPVSEGLLLDTGRGHALFSGEKHRCALGPVSRQSTDVR